MNRLFIKLESSFVLIMAISYYFMKDLNWWLFALLLLVPDLFMIGYSINNKVGAFIYNIAHTYIASLLLFIIGFIFEAEITLSIGIIWTSHIAMDRALGFGLKYPTSFKDTHIQRL